MLANGVLLLVYFANQLNSTDTFIHLHSFWIHVSKEQGGLILLKDAYKKAVDILDPPFAFWLGV